MQNGLARIAYNEVRDRGRDVHEDHGDCNIFLIFLLPFIPIIVVGYVTWVVLVFTWHNLLDVMELLKVGFIMLGFIYLVGLIIKIIGKEKFMF
jgi:hypothetical protein